MADRDELALDLEELKQLQSIAKRPRVAALISSEIRNVEKLSVEVASAQTEASVSIDSKLEVNSAEPKTAPKALLNYTTIDSFSWGQTNDQLKIYIYLEGVDEEKIETDFMKMSFDVMLHDVQGRSYRFAVPMLNKEIVPEKCKLVVRPMRVIITLAKASEGNWLDLKFKEDKLKPSLDKEQDPMAGIMDLMKNMYVEGDDEMKKTIGKAWTDARSGKAADPTKSYR